MPPKGKSRAKSKSAARRSLPSATRPSPAPKRRATTDAAHITADPDAVQRLPSEIPGVPADLAESPEESGRSCGEPEASAEEAAEGLDASLESEPSKPEAPVDLAQARAEKLAAMTDPWCELEDEQVLANVDTETWAVLELKKSEGSEADSALHVDGKGDELYSFPDAGSWVSLVVSLDFSGNLLECLESMPAMWLRNLSLANNPLSSLAGLGDVFPKLMCIDLSFVDMTSVEGAWPALAACSHLKIIEMEGCSVDDLDGMHDMPSLLSLNLEENEIEDFDAISWLGIRCPNLQMLNLRENPVAVEPGYQEAIAQHLPNLLEHDNQSKRKYKVCKPRDGLCCARSVHVIDGLYQGEGCSCLHGNPCLDSSTCLDWTNRFQVAAAARNQNRNFPQQWSMGFSLQG